MCMLQGLQEQVSAVRRARVVRESRGRGGLQLQECSLIDHTLELLYLVAMLAWLQYLGGVLKYAEAGAEAGAEVGAEVGAEGLAGGRSSGGGGGSGDSGGGGGCLPSHLLLSCALQGDGVFAAAIEAVSGILAPHTHRHAHSSEEGRVWGWGSCGVSALTLSALTLSAWSGLPCARAGSCDSSTALRPALLSRRPAPQPPPADPVRHTERSPACGVPANPRLLQRNKSAEGTAVRGGTGGGEGGGAEGPPHGAEGAVAQHRARRRHSRHIRIHIHRCRRHKHGWGYKGPLQVADTDTDTDTDTGAGAGAGAGAGGSGVPVSEARCSVECRDRRPRQGICRIYTKRPRLCPPALPLAVGRAGADAQGGG
ncbi:hypothetical protein B484DRAFT_61151 [Ochromonadaceae sp. CCMP2298]|nr:hypothetical protein B484DRAFT_61151 [Ochromonadaceae sp. CCMP2298]